MLWKTGLLGYQIVTALGNVIVPSSSSEFSIPRGQASLQTDGSKGERDNSDLVKGPSFTILSKKSD
jgi:hypothetical protein